MDGGGGEYYFSCDKWFDKKEDDGLIERILKVRKTYHGIYYPSDKTVVLSFKRDYCIICQRVMTDQDLRLAIHSAFWEGGVWVSRLRRLWKCSRWGWHSASLCVAMAASMKRHHTVVMRK